jgi:hypothetical protein
MVLSFFFVSSCQQNYCETIWFALRSEGILALTAAGVDPTTIKMPAQSTPRNSLSGDLCERRAPATRTIAVTHATAKELESNAAQDGSISTFVLRRTRLN